MPLQRRLPKRGFVSMTRNDSAEVRLSDLQKMPVDEIDLLALKQAGVVPAATLTAKVMKSGEIKRAVKLRGLLLTKGARAAVEALRQFPVFNASVEGTNILYHNDVNVGIAVALENGLIVPVIKAADEKNVIGLQRSIVDLAARAAGFGKPVVWGEQGIDSVRSTNEQEPLLALLRQRFQWRDRREAASQAIFTLRLVVPPAVAAETASPWKSSWLKARIRTYPSLPALRRRHSGPRGGSAPRRWRSRRRPR